MSLSALLTAVAEYVGQVLVDDCDRPAPTRVLRYLGSVGLPQDCCTEDGVLSVSWGRGFGTARFPAEAGGGDYRDAGVRPAYNLLISYDVCWPIPAVDDEGVTLIDVEWDALAATLSDVADCVARALIRLACNDPASAHAEHIDAVRQHCSDLAYRDVVARVSGGCARLTWQLTSGVRAGGG